VLLCGRAHCVPDEKLTNRDRCGLIEQHAHSAAATGVSRLRAANSMTAFTWSRSSPSYHDRMSSILLPLRGSRKSWRRACGCCKAPMPAHLAGMLSTAGDVTPYLVPGAILRR
jgi:hypothetical protein